MKEKNGLKKTLAVCQFSFLIPKKSDETRSLCMRITL